MRYTTRGMLLIGISGLCLTAGTGCSQQDQALTILSAEPLEILSLKKRERPRSYTLITDTNLFATVGIRANPGYVERRSEKETLLHADAATSFVAIYGEDNVVRLLVKGIYFRDHDDAQKYADVQSTRQRQVVAYRRVLSEGIWLLFIALDPEAAYDESELRDIRIRLKRYQRRLDLELLFDQLEKKRDNA